LTLVFKTSFLSRSRRDFISSQNGINTTSTNESALISIISGNGGFYEKKIKMVNTPGAHLKQK